jgi:hypothetical protein
MVPIHTLWLPILLSAVFVFIASSIVHMMFRYHSNDLKKLPDEDAAADALRKLNIPAGQYIIPHAGSMQAMNSPEYQEKVKRGPGVILTIWPGGRPSMVANLTQWFLYSLVVGIFAAYMAGRKQERIILQYFDSSVSRPLRAIRLPVGRSRSGSNVPGR